ncbi:MAG: sensor histidine kinase [Bacteroidota bacterium]
MPPRGLKIKEVWFHIIGWLVFFLLPIGFALPKIEGTLTLVFISRLLLGMIVFYANYLVLIPQLLLKKKIFLYIFVSISFLILVNVIHFQYTFIPRFQVVPEFINRSERGIMFKSVRYFVPGMVMFAFFLLGGTVGLVKNFYQRDKIFKEREIEKTLTELQFLKNQLNPHFLFNSLNSIYSLVRNKSQQAPEAVITLSELMRYMLYEANEKKLPLSKEIDYIKNYITLQRLRLLNSECVTLLIKGDYEGKKIYPLLLISYIENAFKYGTDFKGNTDIAIVIEIIDEKLSFKVNNIIGTYSKDEKSSGIGLDNIKNRLELLYPDLHTLTINKEDGRYFVNLELILA